MAKQRKLTKYSIKGASGHYQYTKGREYSLNGVEYIGEYHDNNGVKYTGPIPSDLSKPLQRYYSNPLHYQYEKVNQFDVSVAKFVDPIPHVYTPRNQAYTIGFDLRYFVEKINDVESYAIEISQQQFRSIGQQGGIDSGLYTYISIQWKLTGTVSSITEHNQLELTRASYTVPSIVYAVKNFTEFGRITELNSPLKDVGSIPVVQGLPRQEDILNTVRNYDSNRVFVTGSV